MALVDGCLRASPGQGLTGRLAAPPQAHPGGDIPAARCRTRLGCQPGAQTQSRRLQEQGVGTKGYLHSHTLQVYPWPGQTAVFQGHAPAPRGYSKAHLWLKATPLPAFGSEAQRHCSSPRRSHQPFFLNIGKIVFFSRCHSQEQLHNLA